MQTYKEEIEPGPAPPPLSSAALHCRFENRCPNVDAFRIEFCIEQILVRMHMLNVLEVCPLTD